MEPLTREAVLAMPAGPDMDALVATRVMGWTHWQTYRFPNGDEEPVWSTGDEESPSYRGFRASTQIVEAWMVVRRLRDLRDYVSLFAGNGWAVRAWSVTMENKHVAHVEAGSDDQHDLPLAICRAALLTTLEPA